MLIVFNDMIADMLINCENSNKPELQQINHWSFMRYWLQYFINLYKKCTAKSYSFLVMDTTLASDNHSRFRKNLLERISKLITTIDDKIKMKNCNIIL